MLSRLNHVAIAVPDLEAAVRLYRDVFGAAVSAPVDLPEHGVTAVFVDHGTARLELVTVLGDASPIARFLARRPDGGIHHLCYEVADLEAALLQVRAAGIRVIGDGRPKPGTRGKPVVFLHPKDCAGTLIELEQA